MNISINSNVETLEDLSRNGYRIIQRKEGYRFGEDTVLLADFLYQHVQGLPRDAKCVDLGANSGASTILLLARRPEYHITSVEVQENPFLLLKRNINLNSVSDKVTPVHADVRDIRAKKIIQGSAYDLVYTNPPYFSPNRGFMSSQDLSNEVNIARFEIIGTLLDFVSAAAYALRPGGIFGMVYRVSRLSEVFDIMRKMHIEPMTVRFIHAHANKPALHFLIAARKGSSRSDLMVLPPLILRDSNGRYTEEYYQIYGKTRE